MSVSDIIAVIGLVVSVVGIPLTFVLARRTRQRPELRYVIDFDVILSQDSNLFDRGLFMTLGTYRIDSISRTRIAIWNHRGDTIHKADILDSDPLRIQLKEDDQALQSRILSMSRKQIGLAAEIDAEKPSSVQIAFEFLDINDGAIIEIIHRGPSKPTILGTLQGADMRDTGSADLGPETIRASAQGSRMRRFLARRDKFILFLPIMLFPAGAILLGVAWYLSSSVQPSHLVDVSKYHLNTIPGQVAFATAVSQTKAFQGSATGIFTIFLLIFSALIIVASVIMFYFIMRKKVPWNIALYRTNDESDNKSSDIAASPSHADEIESLQRDGRNSGSERHMTGTARHAENEPHPEP